MMPLGMANVGDVNIIKRITGRDDVRQHLAELGFVVGGESAWSASWAEI